MCKIASTGEESVGWMCSKNGREQVMKRADALRVEGRRRWVVEMAVKQEWEGSGEQERGTVGSGDGWWRLQ